MLPAATVDLWLESNPRNGPFLTPRSSSDKQVQLRLAGMPPTHSCFYFNFFHVPTVAF
jgi:hypothetical protein